MKILHINTYDVGGAAKACIRIHNALVQEQIDSSILFRIKTNNRINKAHEIWEELSVFRKIIKLIAQKIFDLKNAAINKKVGINELFSNFRTIWDVTESTYFKEADIIHLHWISGFVDLSTFFRSTQNKIVIWTIHDYAPFNYGLHYPFEDSRIFEKEMFENKKLISSALNKKITIVSPSRYLMKVSKNSECFAPFEHHQITNCTDTKTYKFFEKMVAREKLALPINKKIILFISENIYYKRKGFDVLVEAMKQLNKKDILLLCVGNHFDTPQLPNETKYTGFVRDEKKLNLFYAAADVFVSPSLNDNLPNTISESLCSGTPVVAFNVGGIGEMIKHNTNGILVENINAKNLSEAIATSLSLSWDNLKIANEAYTIYNEKACANKYIDLYQNLILDEF